jgi:hypothetical protein
MHDFHKNKERKKKEKQCVYNALHVTEEPKPCLPHPTGMNDVWSPMSQKKRRHFRNISRN